MLPNLSDAPRIAIDVETYDPNLKKLGPGDRRRDGFVAGIAVGTDEDQWYLPIRHEGGGNLPVESVLAWARRELTRENQPKVGANLIYDLGWLQSEGVDVVGPFYDVQVAEPLLDEHADTYALDALASKYLGETKDDSALYEHLAQTFGGKPTRNAQAGRIWRAPGPVVEDYAKSDVRLPLQVWDEQMQWIKAEELERVLDLETRLLPLLHEMRLKGVRVDLDRARQVRAELVEKRDAAQRKLNQLAGFSVNVHAPAQIQKAFDAQGYDYPLTAKGNPSFTKTWLEGHPSELSDAILDVRRYDKAIGTFLDGHIFGHVVGDRIHPQFLQLRSDDGGTVSGRLSSKNPNCQQLPSRDPELGPLIRSIFIPEEGEQWWSLDYSQIEYKVFAHYASGPGSDDVRERYQDPDTDFHDMTANLIQENSGKSLGRKTTKNVSFLSLYGGSAKKLASTAGVAFDEAEQIFESYHEGLPCVRQTFRKAQHIAERRGWIRTYGGRKCRYPLWEPSGFTTEKPLPYKEALEVYGPSIKRANTRKALNNLIQGSAADLMKMAMVNLYESGYPVPMLTVHDEICLSLPPDYPVDKIRAVMEDFNLRVPVIADVETGPNWGNLDKTR